MSGASHTSAAVFTNSPQSVEIYERGAWWPGSMLGWRHDDRGTCQAWVRVEFGGVVEDAWVELTLLRLPEAPVQRNLTPARQPKGASVGARTGVREAVAPTAQASDVPQTQHLPLVRGGGVPPAARRVPLSGGRRRAPETGEQPVPPARSAVDCRPMGRHRAPAAEGRHRAVDTGLSGALPPAAGAGAGGPWSPDRWAPPPPRAELPPAGPVVRATSAGPEEDEALLTRPLRLEEGGGAARRSRRASLTGA